MRIVAGKFKGRQLVTPKGRNTRPTSDRTREAVFNILAHAEWAPPIEGARVLDGFAGSGALGFEAMSRGARFCLFIDVAGAARAAIRTNAEAMSLFGVTRIHRRSADALGDMPANLGKPFDLVFLDPPYDHGLVLPTLASLQTGSWLSDNAALVVETGRDEDIDFDGWQVCDVRTYGAAKVSFIRG
ncbi:MAG: 16S rRNA (guanine(966)-N(2))-methyltransferase RsmD [Pseudomonadota bacterium]